MHLVDMFPLGRGGAQRGRDWSDSCLIDTSPAGVSTSQDVLHCLICTHRALLVKDGNDSVIEGARGGWYGCTGPAAGAADTADGLRQCYGEGAYADTSSAAKEDQPYITGGGDGESRAHPTC